MKDPRFGSAPILESLVFMDESKREEWENMDEVIKRSTLSLLTQTADRLSNKASIEMLCNIIMDMDKRLKKLEEK